MDNSKQEPLWGHIYSLIVLAEAGSYTAAAQRLSLSKSAVSLRIAELEKIVGIELVQRTTRSVRVTLAGQRLIDSSTGYYAGIQRQFSELCDSIRDPRGVVRVTAPVALGRQQIMPRLAIFFESYPDVRIELELSDQIVSLAKEGFDLAIRHTNSVPDTHVATNICRTQAILVATASYLKRRGEPSSPEDLAGHDCLHYLRRGQIPSWSFVRNGCTSSRTNVQISGPIAANNSEALREAALSSLGIALLPDFSAAKDVQEEKLVHVLPSWHSTGFFGDHLYIVRPYSPYVPMPVRMFSDFVRAQLKEGFNIGIA